MSTMRNTDEANRIASEAMTEAHGRCDSVYVRVDAARDALRAGWQGGASNTYSEALVLWLEELRLITNGMSRMVETFGGTVQSMHAVEDTNTLEGSALISQLNPNQASS
ncbi:hypothetical protein SAMN05421803_1314 [Nocardiopsis flavescens]|uniref:WXG100 family type VII secretion target n=1 Tax=Nocardiopsis flavescens TaxID=758803 RepID=A0A1M6V0E3_9ACTN|nr:hypothetical protein [Nocardiopsis flavescens]SHK74923.1 hypothetical protein SAMN05421803_1314 [Nocardiopsis flavescens]